jgi:hypothetical protein
MERDKIIADALKPFMLNISKLGCSNHSCYFNPPGKGFMGTNGSCSCLNSVRPWKLRQAIINLHNELKAAPEIQHTTKAMVAPLASASSDPNCEYATSP